jgi:hypothetical protein
MNDHHHGQPMSRRAAARYSMKALLAAGVSILGLSLSTRNARAGYGECSVSGCNCKHYMGNDQTCSNCGHSFQLHW